MKKKSNKQIAKQVYREISALISAISKENSLKIEITWGGVVRVDDEIFFHDYEQERM